MANVFRKIKNVIISTLGRQAQPRPQLEAIMLERLIARLPEELRIVHILHDVERLNNAEIAQFLSIDEPAVRLLVNTARQELRHLWQQLKLEGQE